MRLESSAFAGPFVACFIMELLLSSSVINILSLSLSLSKADSEISGL